MMSLTILAVLNISVSVCFSNRLPIFSEFESIWLVKRIETESKYSFLVSCILIVISECSLWTSCLMEEILPLISDKVESILEFNEFDIVSVRFVESFFRISIKMWFIVMISMLGFSL